jgi:hypothetical protein
MMSFKGHVDKKRHPGYSFERGGSEHDNLFGGGRRIQKSSSTQPYDLI